MCGRFFVSEAELDDFAALVEGIEKELLKPRPNRDGTADLVPGDGAPVLVDAGYSGPASRVLTWGFPGPGGKGRIINARAETVMEKPMFRLPFQGHRCIIPAAGFYEWRDADADGEAMGKEEGPVQLVLPGMDAFEATSGNAGIGRPNTSRPAMERNARKMAPRIRYRFLAADGRPLAMGGIYWTFPIDAVTKLTAFTIITVAANEDVQPIHDRMPLLLPQHAISAWLHPGMTAQVGSLLVPAPIGLIRCEPSLAEA